MFKNVGSADRIIRILISLFIIGILSLISVDIILKISLLFLSCYLLYTSFTSQCFFYLIFLISTKKKRQRTKIKECSNNIITVFWSEKKCLNSTMCVNQKKLRETKYHKIFEFFHPKNRPWIKSFGKENTEEIIRAVENCTSGALTYVVNADIREYRQMLKKKIKVLDTVPLSELQYYE